MAPIKKSKLQSGDIINEFEVIELVKDNKYRPLYKFRCLNCGKIVIKNISQIRYYNCLGCKAVKNTKKIFESLKDNVYKGHRCIGYDIELRHTSYKHTSIPILIFECIHCGKTVKVSAVNYFNGLKMCKCKELPRALEKETVSDFIIEPTNEFVANSRNIRYKATCQHCGYILRGQHSALVKRCKDGCKHHIHIDEQYISKKYLKCNQKDEIVKKIKEIKDNLSISFKGHTNLDLIFRDLNMMRKIKTRMMNRLKALDDEKLKIKYKNVIEEMLIGLNEECK